MSQTLTGPRSVWPRAYFSGSVRFPPHDERDILAAEAERIRHPGYDTRVSRLVRHDVERDCRIRNIVVDRGRNALVFERQQGEYRLDDAGGGESMPSTSPGPDRGE
jgi:hypothetical protein